MLDNLKPQKFDFSLLDYVDISSKVRKHSKNPLYPFLLGFSFNNLKEIPKEILEIIGVKGEWLKSVHDLLKNFKIFREEKIIIKTIKFKAEIINADKKQWKALDKVCRHLVLG